ncbi:MAG: hypothetical protein ACTH2Q_04825 [Propionibacteriaceae bacterium]
MRSHTHASPQSYRIAECLEQGGVRTGRVLVEAGLATFEENDTECCYALQDKVWVHGPGSEPWEVYVVKADANALGKSVSESRNGASSRP